MNFEQYAADYFVSIVGGATILYLGRVWRNQKKRRIESLHFERKQIEAYSKSTAELVKDSLGILFYLISLIAFAGIIRLFHGLLYDPATAWQQVLTEGGIWSVVMFLAIKQSQAIRAIRNKSEAIKKIDQKIQKMKE